MENINLTEQLNKFKSLINAKSGEIISEQDDAVRAAANKIQGDIRRATAGAGTNANVLLAAIKQINSLQLYNAVNGLLKQTPIGDNFSIREVLNDELGSGDAKLANDIKKHLASIGKNITFTSNAYDVAPGSFKISSTAAADSALAISPMEREKLWQTTYSCVTKQPGAKAVKLNDGTTTYFINGVYYYNAGRKKLADGTMANYSCTTEFKTNTGNAGNTTDTRKRNSKLGQRFAKSTQSLGIQNGKMDVDTLQKILTSLEGNTPKAKTANDFLPQEVPADALVQQQTPVDTPKAATPPSYVEA